MASIAVVVILAARIYIAQSDILRQAENNYKEGRAILLDKDIAASSFASILKSHGYIQSEEEATFIAKEMTGRLRQQKKGRPGSIRSLGEKEYYGIELDSSGFARIAQYPYLRERAEQLAGGEITDTLSMPVIDKSFSQRYSVKIRNKGKGIHTDTVYLRIREHYNDTVKIEGKVTDCHSMDSVFAWIPVSGKSDIWLPEKDANGNGRYFSVVPIEKGYVYGSEQGTYQNRACKFKFIRTRAILPILGRELLKRAREDNSILIRSPHEYRDKYISAFALFAGLWIFVFFILLFVDRRREGESNLEILAVIALLTGIGMLNLFSLQNPLWGELFAWTQMKRGLIIGLVMLTVFSLIDWVGVYRYSRKEYLSSGHPERQGVWMAFGAICIALILLLFGHGPGGTHVTMPLLPVQGSPIIKILVIGYLSVFFACRSELLEAYSKPGKMRKQLATLFAVLIVCFALGVLQLAISDLGPFLVIAVTVIFVFSLYTGETLSMLTLTSIFSVALLLCNHFFDYSFLPFVLFLVFAIAWVIISYYKNERIKFSPVVLCLLVLLVFHGGNLFKLFGQEDIAIASRLNGRSEIAANIFDNEVLGGSQIAEGIWAITRGGLFGAPQFGLSAGIPAGHTDLSYESVVENMGIIGGVAVLICIGLFLFMSLRIGVRNGHPFGFAIASMLAMSVGIQAVMIVLGSLGILPLTGVTLPFVSYGGTALAVDLACIGILISLSRHKDIELECLNTQRFEKVAQGLMLAYVILALTAMGVVINYGLVSREEYMVKTGKFINRSGERISIVNPLIDATKKRLLPGDIYDRNGIVLATTNNGIRNYPYGSHTIFTLGNLNEKTLWGTAGKRSSGLLAEERFETVIKGFDTRPVYETLESSKHYSPFLPDVPMVKKESAKIEDYRPILPMMLSEKKLREWNERQAERNLLLTIDVELQKGFSEKAAEFVRREIKKGIATDKTRVSIVAMDASDGSLLCSSMYPLAVPDTLRKLAMTKTYVYRDWTPGFKAYTEMDLGLVPLAPGSAVKPLTAGAGLRRFSTELAGEHFNQRVYNEEIIDVELGEPVGDVDLKTALIRSSNIYFIKLLNQYGEEGLYPELAYLYYSVGAGFGNAMPYTLYPEQFITSENSYNKQMSDFGEKAATRYSEYEASETRHKMNDAEYQPAWGQGQVIMSPLSLCRYVAAIANDGVMMSPRYSSEDSVKVYRQLLSADEARLLQDCMKGQAADKFGEYSSHIGGKTGTPNRVDRSKAGGISNDALYAFFIDADGTAAGNPLAVVVRLERVNANSKLAMQMVREVVLPMLKEKGYIL